MGFSEEEFKLRSAQRHTQGPNDLDIVQFALFGMHRANEIYTSDPYSEGVEVYGSQKQKRDTLIDKEIHRPDTINFFQPRLAKRVTRACVATSSIIVEEQETSAE